ncbi:hypothetical protein U9M48_021321 [Paspalum notatum var. saurae]|uniref:Uncharacterized protein n=1 Tax=Paspalum notatum var. saurae TaxID=547442 RepID=A0AAQ3TJB6_PASNO
MAKLALGHHREAADAGCVRAVAAEFILTFLFVFAGVGAAMATGRLAGGADSVVGLTAVALAHTLVVAVMVSAGLHVSGGHINPAVTLGLAVTGRITLFRSALYVAAQLLGSSLACLLLAFLTGCGGAAVPVHALAPGVGALRGVLMEAVLTFSLLFAVYATAVDQRCGSGAVGPLLVGLVVGANVLAGGPFSGASMNPARSFGPALAAGVWADQWVYWVGPLIGGPLAGLVYDGLFMDHGGHMAKLALGHRGEASEPDFFRGVLGELILTFLFVFIGVGAAMTASDADADAGTNSRQQAGGNLTAVALGQALVVVVIATAGFHISGGHVNPAVTLSMAVGGHITLFRSALYVVAQMLGSSAACVLLRWLTGGHVAVPVHALAAGVGPLQGVVAEVVFTFSLLFVIHATILDPRKILPGSGPALTGVLVGANSIAGAVLSGASMNPARSFGPALAAGDWTHHWVYWVGPLAGGPLAVLVYECLFMPPAARTHELLPGQDQDA